MSKLIQQAIDTIIAQRPEGLVDDEDTIEFVLEMGFRQGVAWYAHMLQHIINKHTNEEAREFVKTVFEELDGQTVVHISDDNESTH